MHTDIFLLWEHKAFTCHFYTIDSIPLGFCTVHVTIHFSRKRQASAANSSQDLHTYWAWYFPFSLRQTWQLRRFLWLWNVDSCECVVFPQKEYIFMHDISLWRDSKSTRTFLECKGIPVLEWQGNSPDMNPIENVWNIMKNEIGNQMLCKKKIFGCEYAERGIV